GLHRLHGRTPPIGRPDGRPRRRPRGRRVFGRGAPPRSPPRPMTSAGTARARALVALRLAGPAGALALHLLGDGPAMSMAGVAFWVALWWVTEAMPLAATSLLPAVLLPL